MTARKKPSPITVDAGQCLSLLTNVARAASTDNCLPMINGVLLHGAVHDEKPVLVASATDRFIFVQGSIDATGEPLPEVFVSLDEIKRVAVVLRSLPKASTLLEVSASADGSTVFAARNASATTEPKTQGKDWTSSVGFPDFQHLFAEPKLTPEVEVGKVAVNGGYLAKLATMAKAVGADFRLHTYGAAKPTHILIGDRYRALIMPVRQHGEITMLPLFVPPAEQKRMEARTAEVAKPPAAKKPAARKASARPAARAKRVAA